MSSLRVKLDKNLFDAVSIVDKAEYRSAVQHNFGDKVGCNALANPDLPVEFIRDILIAKELPKEPFDMELEE